MPNSIHSSWTGLLTNIYQQRQPFVLGLHLRGVRGDPGILSSYLTLCPPSQTAVWPKQDSLQPSHRSHLLTSIKSIIFKWSLPFREHRHTVTSLLSPSLTELFFRGLTCHFSCWHMSVFLFPLSDILNPVRIHFYLLYHKHLRLFMHNLLIMSHLYNHNGINENS